MPNTGTLCIARHHESEWNKMHTWTGSRDVHPTPYGMRMSGEMGLQIADIHIDHTVTSEQHRAKETLAAMLHAMGQEGLPTTHSPALNERDYGDYTGKNKLIMKELLGEGAYTRMHREWDYPIPHGESLKMVYERAVPYYEEVIVPLLRDGNNVLLVSHGNTIRSLMKYIEGITDHDIQDVEMLFGSILIYRVDVAGRMLSKEIRFTEGYEPTR